jgi:hypothetical protein
LTLNEDLLGEWLSSGLEERWTNWVKKMWLWLNNIITSVQVCGKKIEKDSKRKMNIITSVQVCGKKIPREYV